MLPASKWSLIKRLLKENARSHVRGYLAAFLCMIFVAGATAMSAWIMEDVIDEIFIRKNEDMLYVIAAIVVGIFAIKGAATYGQQVILNTIGNGIVAQCQKRIYAHMLKQDLAFIHAHEIGDFIAHISRNTGAARTAINLLVTSLGRDVLGLLALVGVMIAKDPVMTVLVLGVAPIAVLGISRLVRRVKRIARQEFFSQSEVISATQQIIAGARVVRAFCLETVMINKASRAIGDVEVRANKIARLQARVSPIMETLGGISVALVILYGGYSVIAREQDPGAFFAFITALLMAYEPAKRLSRLSVQLERELAGVRLMYEFLDAPIRLRETTPLLSLHVITADVCLEDVSFQYVQDGMPVLSHVNLTAAPGGITALVGPSGAGKSTIFNLLSRFYDPSQGRILIDGTDIRTVSMASLRHHIALVNQDTFLFNGTIFNNIAYGRAGASSDQIVQAAKRAHAHEFIMNTPEQYDTILGDGGMSLSGGQAQRIAIARAMLKDAPILLLDEATSALDTESEMKVRKALETLMKDRTTFVIAHRLSTVRNADKICVFDQGRLVQTGTHDELIAQGGLYKRLYQLQFQDSNLED